MNNDILGFTVPVMRGPFIDEDIPAQSDAWRTAKQVIENTIPPITHPWGQAWDQPNRFDIKVTSTEATMSHRTFSQLKEYSHSYPSGVYAGKMWRREVHLQTGITHYLLWFSDIEDKPNNCRVNQRRIVLIDP